MLVTETIYIKHIYNTSNLQKYHKKEKIMELTRVDYVVLKFLKKKKCTSYFMSATLQEIMQITNNSRPTTYRRMMNLRKHGYVEKGCKSINADTFYLLEKGLKIVESGGMEND